jgi:hypothetical protein
MEASNFIRDGIAFWGGRLPLCLAINLIKQCFTPSGFEFRV